MAPVIDSAQPQKFAAARDFARRAARVRLFKFVLPVLALFLLTLVAMWPEIERSILRARAISAGIHFKSFANGIMVSPRFRGLDGRDQPYVLTADTAIRVSPERVNLIAPKGDLAMRGGDWLMVIAPYGVYQQRTDQLDLSGWVTLYRSDGTLLMTPSATVDVHQGVASSSEQTHVEGPFGTLDAQGFTLVDKGAVVQFQGPATLVLNGQQH